jgi:hypothetical protein
VAGLVGRFSRRALLAAAGGAVVAGRFGGFARAAAATYHRRFGRLPDQRGWGPHWFSPHYARLFDVRKGEGRLHLRPGLPSTAPNQPLPLFLLDHQCSDSTQELHFRVTNRTLRPGVLFRCRDAFHFFGVTVEDGRLVLATYSRTNRDIIAHAQVPKLGLGTQVMRVVVSGGRVTAGLWRAGGQPRTQLRASVTGTRSGGPGVLMVAPTNRRAASLLVSRYRLASSHGFRVTSPKAAFLITGTPQAAAGQIVVGLRAASAISASIQFEWSNDPTLRTGVRRSAVLQPQAPYAARTDIVLSDGEPVYWRARFVATHSHKAHHSAIQRYKPHGDNDLLVMAAASCAHLWGLSSYAGLERVLEAAPVEPAMLVYQGDLGYAGNSRFSAYLQAPDFYAERFTRTLADPYFTALRRQIPVGFTADDHDYAEDNNASPDQFPGWSVPLWNQVHADPSNLGYNDWRFGDVHCLTLDGRRYADHVEAPNVPSKTKLGVDQRAWLENIVETTDANLIVIFSADIFASRRISIDCWMFGWPDEYSQLMTLFMSAQLRGVRVVILSGDAHGLRIHHHPDPAGRAATRGYSVVEFVCSGLAPRSWSGSAENDLTLDPSRFVLGKRGLGMIVVGPPAAAPNRVITLRAISGAKAGPTDLFAPLDLSFHPSADSSAWMTPAPEPPAELPTPTPE